MLVPVRSSWALQIPVPTRHGLTGSGLLVPRLDFLPPDQQQLGRPAGYTPPSPPWATRACRNLGTTVGYPEIIPTTKTKVVAPSKQTREKIVGDRVPMGPRTGRALSLGTDNKNSGPRGH